MKKILSRVLILCILLLNLSPAIRVSARQQGQETEIREPVLTATASSAGKATPSTPEHDHVYEQKTFHRARCLEDVTNIFTCRYCDASQEEVTKAVGHLLKEIKVSEQLRCFSDETYIKMCDRCGEITENPVAVVTRHGMDRTLLSTRRDCGPYRYDLYRCNLCGQTGEVRKYEGASSCNYITSKSTQSTCTDRGYIESFCKDKGIRHPANYVVSDYLDHDMQAGVCTMCKQTSEELSRDYEYTVEIGSMPGAGGEPVEVYYTRTLKKDEPFTIPDVLEGYHTQTYIGIGSNLNSRTLIPGNEYKNLSSNGEKVLFMMNPGLQGEYPAPVIHKQIIAVEDGSWIYYNESKMPWDPWEFMNRTNLNEKTKAYLWNINSPESHDMFKKRDLILTENPREYADEGEYRPFYSSHILSDTMYKAGFMFYPKSDNRKVSEEYQSKVKVFAEYPGGVTDQIELVSLTEVFSTGEELLDGVLSTKFKQLKKYKVTGFEITDWEDRVRSSLETNPPEKLEELYFTTTVKLIYGYADVSVRVDTNNGKFNSRDQDHYRITLPAGPIATEELAAIHGAIRDIERTGYTFNGIMADTSDPWEPGDQWYGGRWYRPLGRDTLEDTFIVSGDTYIIPRWKPNKVNLTINWNHNKVTADNLHWKLDYGSYIPKFEAEEPEGWRIAGYFTEKDGSGEQMGTRVLFEDTVFYADWVKEDVDVPEPPTDPDPEDPKPPTDPDPEDPKPPTDPDLGNPKPPTSNSGTNGGGNKPGSSGSKDNGTGPGYPQVPPFQEVTQPQPPSERPPVDKDVTGKEVPRRLTEAELTWYIENNEVPLGYMRSADGGLVWIGDHITPMGLPKTGDVGNQSLQHLIYALFFFAIVICASGEKGKIIIKENEDKA